MNSVDRSSGKHLIVTGDDFGNVNLYRYPCVSKKVRARLSSFFRHPSHHFSLAKRGKKIACILLLNLLIFHFVLITCFLMYRLSQEFFKVTVRMS